eukprot:TRINITY_DN8992_c0_g1_i1.p1 TRINITY_DN8992_c0_g1~~TRINITY_DN8992_c0_g1_i1.p1  ORF type:complete len:126 (-),score=23.36 TRINITY_DN8992_c0_g1_i1:62-439(-)
MSSRTLTSNKTKEEKDVLFLRLKCPSFKKKSSLPSRMLEVLDELGKNVDTIGKNYGGGSIGIAACAWKQPQQFVELTKNMTDEEKALFKNTGQNLKDLMEQIENQPSVQEQIALTGKLLDAVSSK